MSVDDGDRIRDRERADRGARSVRVLIVEESSIFRAGLRSLLDGQPCIDVVGEVGSPAPATAMAAQTAPDLVILGVGRVDAEVEDVAADLVGTAGTGAVIVLGEEVDPGRLKRLVHLGVRAYLPKDVELHYLVSIAHLVCPCDDRVVLSTADPFRPGGRAARPDGGPTDAQTAGGAADVALSSREREIMVLVASARTNAQIGRELGIAEGTVKRHLRNVFTKLDAVSRIDAVNKAGLRSVTPPAAGPSSAAAGPGDVHHVSAVL